MKLPAKWAGLLTLVTLLASALAVADLPGEGLDAGRIVVYRDTWGVPHIYADTMNEGLYAQGWAQAQDRPEQLLQNLAFGIGEASRFGGQGVLRSDVVSRLFEHYAMAQRNWHKITPEVREQLNAFVQGINDYYERHPHDVPEWWGDRQVDAQMIIAFSRLFLYNWSIDEGFGDLRRGGIEPGFEMPQRGSNQWAISPERSATGAPILYIDPHLSWWGPSRFWEFRVHAGEWRGSGFTLPGSPYIGLGHNEHVSWAMTTGGPDTADIYELTLNEDNPQQYIYDGEWRDLRVEQAAFQMPDGSTVEMNLAWSHLGPIVATREGKAYANAMAYHDVVELNEAWYTMNMARDYRGVEEALASLTLFPQNIMAADTEGNTYYQRTGRVPIRPEGYDWSRPVPGDTSETAWQGFHPASDLVQILNPDQGYMQNNNIPPDMMMVDSPMTPDRYPDYIFGDNRGGGWSQQRGARAIELLHNDNNVTIEAALEYAVDIHPYGVDRWVDALRRAHEAHGADHEDDEAYSAGMQNLLEWDQTLHRESTGALKYYYWRHQLHQDFGAQVMSEVRGLIDRPELIALGEEQPEVELSEEQMREALGSFARAMATLDDHFSLDAAWGDKFRVGRDDQSWPLGGGGDGHLGVTTVRNIGWGGEREDHTRWGQSGQTSTQVVVMTQPVQSWSFVPVGQSDRPNSPHYTDQAERLFSPREFKPTWWTPDQLAQNIASREVLLPTRPATWEPPSAAALDAAAGTWEGTVEVQGEAAEATLILRHENGSLSGTWNDRFGETELEEIRTDGEELSFSRTVTSRGTDYEIIFRGQLEDGSLSGAFHTDVGPLDVQMQRTAEAAPEADEAPADLGQFTGVWQGTLVFLGDRLEATLTLREENGALEGTWTDNFGETEVYDIEVHGADIAFGRTVTYQGENYDIVFEGEVQNAQLTGAFFTEVGPLQVQLERAEEEEAVEPADLDAFTGDWEGTLRFMGETIAASMTLREENGALEGVWLDSFGETPLVDLQVSEDDIAFGRTVNYQGVNYDISFEGSVENGALSGVFYTEAGPLQVQMERLDAETGPDLSAFAGSWAGNLSFMGESVPVTLTLEEANGQLEGVWTDTFGESELRNLETDENAIRFSRTAHYQGTDYNLNFRGQIENGAITGAFSSPAGPLQARLERIGDAEDAPAAAAALGQWEGTLVVQGEEVAATLVLAAENGALHGTWRDQFGESELADVVVEENALFFERTVRVQGTDYPLQFEGDIEGVGLTGTFFTPLGPLSATMRRVETEAAATRAPLPQHLAALGVQGADSALAEILDAAQPQADAAQPVHYAQAVPPQPVPPQPVPTPLASPDVTGVWEGELEFGGQSRPVALSIENVDGVLRGTWESPQGEAELQDVQMDGATLRFSRTLTVQGQEYKVDFEGQVDGEELAGALYSPAGPLPLQLHRAADTPAAHVDSDALGTWSGSMSYQGQSLEVTLTLSEENGELHGTWEDDLSADELQDVVLEDNVLSFTRTVIYQGQRYAIPFEGDIEDNTLAGTFFTEVGPIPARLTREEEEPAEDAVPGLADLAGVWEGTTTIQGQQMPSTLSLRIEDDALQGTWQDMFGETDIRNIEVDDEGIAFDRTVPFQGQQYEVTFEGQLSENELTGTFYTELGPLPVRLERVEAAEPVEEEPVPETAGLSGVWTGSTTIQGQEMPSTLTLRIEDDELQGTWQDMFGETEIRNIEVDEDGIAFDRTVPFQGQQYEVTFDGQVSENELTGTFYTELGPLPVRLERVEAETPAEEEPPAPETAELLGTWEGTTEIQGQSMASTLILRQVQGALEGRWQDSFGDTQVDNLALEEGHISFDRTISYQGEDQEISFSGQIENGELRGDWETGLGTLPSRLTRMPDEEPEPEEEPAPEEPAAPLDAEAIALVSGHWEGTVNIQGQMMPAALELREHNGELQGTWADELAESEIYEIEVLDDMLAFGRTVPYGGQNYSILFEGEFTENTLAGVFYTELGPLQVEMERVGGVEETAFLGVWEVRGRVDGTPLESVVEIVRDSEGTLIVSVEDPYGSGEARNVRLEDDRLRFQRAVTYDGSQYLINFEGRVENDTLRGTYYTDLGPIPLTGERRPVAE